MSGSLRNGARAGSQEEGAMLVDSILFSAAMIGVLLFVGVLLWVDFRPQPKQDD
jgi:flagellar biogenesis protein FliO